MKNVGERMYIIDDGVIVEWRTCYSGYCAERTVDDTVSQIYETSNVSSANCEQWVEVMVKSRKFVERQCVALLVSCCYENRGRKGV